MWTPDALASERRPWQGLVWRVVEGQSKVSTMKLVDTLDEQMLLEHVLDRSKPIVPASCKGMHWLLSTPFRYWPYPTSSRFRRAGQTEGCFYASGTPETAIAEMAFYRLLFFIESPGIRLPTNPLEHTAFSVEVRSRSVLDLTRPPLDRDAPLWTHPTEYAPCLDLADAARNGGIEVLRYLSVRDPQRGMNAALLTPAALVSRQPESSQTWRLFIGLRAVQAFRDMSSAAMEFLIDIWAADPRIAQAVAGHC